MSCSGDGSNPWDCDAVLVNNQKAAQQMAEHLIEQGIKEFAYIGQAGKQHDQRLLGFRAGLLEPWNSPAAGPDCPGRLQFS